MNCVEKLVKKNDEIWGEIRGANKYTMEAQRAQRMGDKEEAESYLHMAGQELEHKDRLHKMAQNALDKARREGNENIAVLEEMWSAMVERQEEELCHVKTKMDQARK